MITAAEAQIAAEGKRDSMINSLVFEAKNRIEATVKGAVGDGMSEFVCTWHAPDHVRIDVNREVTAWLRSLGYVFQPCVSGDKDWSAYTVSWLLARGK